jgi:hypothetical protein
MREFPIPALETTNEERHVTRLMLTRLPSGSGQQASAAAVPFQICDKIGDAAYPHITSCAQRSFFVPIALATPGKSD